VIGGRALPSFSNSNRDCTVDFKIIPQKKLRKAILKEFEGQDPVTVIGTRFDESADRRARMQDRKEDDQNIWVGKDGDFYLSPVLIGQPMTFGSTSACVVRPVPDILTLIRRSRFMPMPALRPVLLFLKWPWGSIHVPRLVEVALAAFCVV